MPPWVLENDGTLLQFENYARPEKTDGPLVRRMRLRAGAGPTVGSLAVAADVSRGRIFSSW